MVQRQYSAGAEFVPGKGTSFRVWAPLRKSVQLVVEGASSPVLLELESERNGYFSHTAKDIGPGTRYRFRVDHEEHLLPDPASRFQPHGPHGVSEVVDPATFTWTDRHWKGIGKEGQVLYEMHVGTFTQEGTWAAAARQLHYLSDLGITCIEMMPVADFPGRWGWGYDGVNLFAPCHLYGRPDDLREFIDRAHGVGLGVILDVVYNHFGPDGNYALAFSPFYLTKKHRNDWGQSINFDDEHNSDVRQFFLDNARYWIAEFHFDGFRFDATQAILDDSPEHILAAMAREARKAAQPRSVYLVCENEPQHTKLVRASDAGGFGLDALWNDDFHHSAMVAISGRRDAYYTDYCGEPQEFVSAAKWNYLYQGQFYRWQNQRRGTPALDLPPSSFVHFLQNHDQIANYGHGFRAHQLSSLAQYRAMTALLLLGPQTPMLFQGQEYAADNRFHYFADHNEYLASLIRKGRSKEMSQFPGVAQPQMQASLPDPAGEGTFRRCKLNIDDHTTPGHQWIFRLHRDLLRLRKQEGAFARAHRRGDIDGAVLGPGAFVLRYFMPDGDDRLLIVNLGRDLHLNVVPEPLMAGPLLKQWEMMWSSEHPDYGGSGTPPLETEGEDWRLPGENWRIPGRCAVVLRPCPCRPTKYAGPKRVGLEEHEMT